ncbi:hypothetical protein SprV_0501916500 [Sparganum proliferum]
MTSNTGKDAPDLRQVDYSCAEDVQAHDNVDGATGQQRMTLLQRASLSQFHKLTEEAETDADLGEDSSPSTRPRSRKSSFVPAGGNLEGGQVFRPLSQSTMASSIEYYVRQQRRQPDGFLGDKRPSETPLGRKQARKGSMFELGERPGVFEPWRRFSAVEGNVIDPCLSCSAVPIYQSKFPGGTIKRSDQRHVEHEETREKPRDSLEEEEGREVTEEEEEEEEEEEVAGCDKPRKIENDNNEERSVITRTD